MNNNILIENIKYVNNAGNIRAVIDIITSDISIYGCKIIQQVGQSPWLAMPSREWVDSDGKKKYSPTIKLGKDFQVAVQNAALRVWEETTNG